MLAKVRRRIAREGLFAGDQRIGVAVSGGADSVALLHVLRRLYPRRSIVVVHLNHGLRGDASDADERFVRQLAARLGCDHFVRQADVAGHASATGENLESAGRRLRYEFFGELRESGHCGVIATAHTRSDQAETVLFRFLRGSGGAGLAGILPTRPDGVVRPFLDVTRAEVLQYLRANSIVWREDRSNQDLAFSRNRIRHDLLPQLRREWNPGVDTALAATAEWAREECRFWDAEISRLRPRCTEETESGLVLDLSVVQPLHIAVQRRLFHALLRDFGIAPRSVHIESLSGLVNRLQGSGIAELPGLRAERSFGSVLFRSSPVPKVPEYRLQVPVPGSVDLPAPGWGRLTTSVVGPEERGALYNLHKAALLDWDAVPKPLWVRGWLPGDRITPVGRPGPRKIKELFQEHRVSSWMRPGWPVIAGGSGRPCVMWVGRFGSDDRFRAKSNIPRVLVIEVSDPSGPNLVPDASKEMGGTTAPKD